MSYKQAYKQVMRGYDEDRHQADIKQKARRQLVYEAIPRVAEIDTLLMQKGIAVSQVILKGAGGSEDMAALKQLVSQLTEEKQRLMVAHGMGEHYLTDIYKCKLCQDTGYINAKKCPCLTQKLVEKYYDVSNVNSIVAVENFDTYDIRYYDEQIDEAMGRSPRANMEVVYKTCYEFVLEFKENYKNLLFYGETGLGKTFLCNCIAKEMLDKGITVLYVTAPQLFKKVEEARFNRDEMDSATDQIEMIFEVDLLIIDDLGSEFATVITNTELFNIVNSRMLARKHTIISTNLSLIDLQNHYSNRIVSRFFGNYKMMSFYGKDIRIKKKFKAYGK